MERRLNMNFIENFKMAMDSIKANKLRSFLTMLGIIIGISSVIAILSLGEGGKSSITGEFEKIGSSTVSIKVNSNEATMSDYFNENDIKQIAERVNTVKYITPSSYKMGNRSSETKSKKASISAGNQDLAFIQSVEMIHGRFFNEIEANEGKAVIVLDEIGAKSLFGYTDVVGEYVTVGPKASAKKARVIGVTKSSQMMFMAENEDMPIMSMVPLSFLESLYPTDFVIDTLYIMADTKENIELAGNSAINVLKSRHNNRDREVYTAESLMKQLDQVNEVLGIFTGFISAVAAISLLVGGIGVMNIMLVSVTERTREIGIRKAIGATTNTILLQFLTESVIISLLGGIIGMILGIVAAYGLGSFAGITPVLSITSIIAVIIFSSSVGIFFGIYPARKAAKLDPIEALRYE